MANHAHQPGALHHEEIGRDGQPHGHHVVSAGTLVGVLLILLTLTGLTVYTAKEWHLGLVGNATLAIVIATVKSTLVCMYFMHLRWDNHFYTVALLSCVMALILFLFFSMADLGTRNAIDPQRSQLLMPVPADKVNLSRFNEIERQGLALYQANCASCHGVRGAGIPDAGSFYGDHSARRGPSLLASAYLSAVSNAELAGMLTKGREKTDPASIWGQTHLPKVGNPALTDEQIMQIVTFVRKITAKDPHGGGH